MRCWAWLAFELHLHAVSLPPARRPEAFGQHPNAEISYLIEDSKALLGGMLSLAPRTGGGGAGSSSSGSGGGSKPAAGGGARQEELVEALANDLLDQVTSCCAAAALEATCANYSRQQLGAVAALRNIHSFDVASGSFGTVMRHCCIVPLAQCCAGAAACCCRSQLPSIWRL